VNLRHSYITRYKRAVTRSTTRLEMRSELTEKTDANQRMSPFVKKQLRCSPNKRARFAISSNLRSLLICEL